MSNETQLTTQNTQSTMKKSQLTIHNSRIATHHFSETPQHTTHSPQFAPQNSSLTTKFQIEFLTRTIQNSQHRSPSHLNSQFATFSWQLTTHTRLLGTQLFGKSQHVRHSSQFDGRSSQPTVRSSQLDSAQQRTTHSSQLAVVTHNSYFHGL